MGTKPNATQPLQDYEIEKLFDKEFFGSSTPYILQRTVWWTLTTHFGFRAGNESRKLCFGDITVKKEELTGRKYLEWDKERGTKTRTGENSSSHQRAFNPKAFQTGGPRCPVLLFEKFLMHRPLESKKADSPFFLQMMQEKKVVGNVWYFNRPLEKNMLGKFMNEAKDVLGADTSTSRSKIANHSARKTSISSLLNNNVNPLHVSQLSGHKNIDSLRSYNTATDRQQMVMSDMISQVQTQQHHSKRPMAINASSVKRKSVENQYESILSSANISNCTFNFNINSSYDGGNSAVIKRRRVVIESDSDSDC